MIRSIDTRNFSIDRYIEMAKGRGRAFSIEFIQDLNEEIVTTTPYKTGFLRGSWFAQLNGEPQGVGSADAGGAAIARMNLVAAGLQVGDIFWAVNGAVYARFVHDGTSRMAPRPWVATVLDRAPTIAEAAARRVGAL